MDSPIKIGLTMRRSDASEYHEPRNGLAISWTSFMQTVLPEVIWTPLPMIGEDISRTAHYLNLDAIILTGGEDIGNNPVRDETELALIALCSQRNIPLLGICRGLQLLQIYFGGELTSCTDNEHIATRHEIFLTNNKLVNFKTYEVNSFHSNCIAADKLVSDFIPLALDKKGNVEACYSLKHPFLGLMWHPEREDKPNKLDSCLIRNLFLKENKPT